MPAESQRAITLNYSLLPFQSGPEYHLNLRLIAPVARGLMEAGHVYAQTQFELPLDRDRFAPALPDGSLSLEDGEKSYIIQGSTVTAAIDKSSGLLSSITTAGKELLLSPLAPNFWRAPTDNDFGNYMPDWAAVWEQAGRNRTLQSLEVTARSDDEVSVLARYAFASASGEQVGEWQATYTMFGDGRIVVNNRFKRADALPVLPRVGMNVELIRELDNVEWFGRGPFENYIDRNLAADVGRYRNIVADHYVPYLRPQENGYKTEVRWLSLDNGADAGLLVVADDLISFGVHHNRMADFIPPAKIAITDEDGPGARDNEERVNIHVNDIVPLDIVSLDIDYGQMGVGGDDSWGAHTLQKYTLNETAYNYAFTLLPYTPGSSRLDQLVER